VWDIGEMTLTGEKLEFSGKTLF